MLQSQVHLACGFSFCILSLGSSCSSKCFFLSFCSSSPPLSHFFPLSLSFSPLSYTCASYDLRVLHLSHSSGYIGDRINLRYFLAIGMIGTGVGVGLLGVEYYIQTHQLWYFILVQVFSGVMQVRPTFMPSQSHLCTGPHCAYTVHTPLHVCCIPVYPQNVYVCVCVSASEVVLLSRIFTYLFSICWHDWTKTHNRMKWSGTLYFIILEFFSYVYSVYACIHALARFFSEKAKYM